MFPGSSFTTWDSTVVSSTLGKVQRLDPTFRVEDCDWVNVIKAAEQAYSKKSSKQILAQMGQKSTTCGPDVGDIGVNHFR